MLNPHDLGNSQVSENCLKIKVDDLVSKVQKELKIRLLQAQMESIGVTINFTTTKTRFNGLRIWFVCPNCQRRIGIAYKHPIEQIIGCRICLKVKYRKQRFKGMIESVINT